jgi:hypothetical protein
MRSHAAQTDPHIIEYDTLTSEERWHDYADIILANPPFMSARSNGTLRFDT